MSIILIVDINNCSKLTYRRYLIMIILVDFCFYFSCYIFNVVIVFFYSKERTRNVLK